MKERRKKYLIDPDFQIKFCGFFLILSLVSISLFYLAVDIFFNKLMELGRSAGFDPGHVFFLFVQNQQSIMNTIFMVICGVLIFVMSVGGLYLSHRVAGPIHRFVTHMKATDSLSSLKEIDVRRKDNFPQLFQSYNDLVNKLRSS